MSGASASYNYEEGKRRIGEWLARSRATGWSPTPEVRRLQFLIDDLESMATRLGGQEWLYLEAAHDAEPPREFDLDGLPIAPGVSNTGRFAGLRLRLQELAKTAKGQLEELPSSRERNEVPHAAQLFLHLRYQCGMPPATLYEGGEAIMSFSWLCQNANVFLSPVRMRNVLSEAVKTFDPQLPPDGFNHILVSDGRSTSSPKKTFNST